MISLKYIINQKFNETKLVELLFYAFPLCFIIGNLIVSINTLLFITVSLHLIKKEKLNFRFNNFFWLLIIFYLYIFALTAYQYLSPGVLNETVQDWPLENNPIFKSFIFVRFVLLIFIIDVLFYNKILNLNRFFLSSLICTSFVSFDLILQYIIGFDIFGYKSIEQWNSGPFGDEMIAGTYLKNFSFFSFFYLFNNLKGEKLKYILPISFILIHLSAILLTGNRMPFLLFLLGYILILLLVKNLRFIMSLGMIIFLAVFFILLKYDDNLNKTYSSFLSEINIVKLFKNYEKNLTKTNKVKIESSAEKSVMAPEKNEFLRWSGYGRIFNTSIEMWEKQPIFGLGLKSFRIICWEMLKNDNKLRAASAIKKPQKITCANHSHNYYLELLVETGIVGLSLLLLFFIFILLKSGIYVLKSSEKINYLFPIFIIFLLEIWPLRSSGSFFTTWGATFFWINTSILASYAINKVSLK